MDRLRRELEELNPAQREAVEHFGSPLLILAGAGSGKTRVISAKIAYLLARKEVEPASILAVTFTNKAAEEMARRTLALVPAAADVTFRTFHSFGARVLRRHAGLGGLSPAFGIYDEEESAALLARIVDELPREAPKQLRRHWSLAELRAACTRISRAKDYALEPGDDLGAAGGQGLTGRPEDEGIAWLYRAYQRRLADTGNVDFGDLILLPLRLIRSHPRLRAELRERHRIILVDEYQDSNRAQFELLEELAGPDTYLCVVGDDDQSIYKFRGAVVQNILSFPDVFAGTRVIRLERNYRSTQRILDVASAVVSHNTGRLGKNLVADRLGGEPVTVASLEDQEAEARYVAELLAEGSYGSTAVLYRMNHQSRSFETLFGRLHIAFRVVGTVRFYERAEVKDAMAYLALLANPRDEVAFLRVANHPPRGIGKKSLSVILARRGDAGGDLLEALRRSRPLVPAAARKGAQRLLDLLAASGEALQTAPLHQIVDSLLRDSGLMEYYAGLDSLEASGRVDNLKELVSSAAAHAAGPEGLAALLEEAALEGGAADPFAPEGKVTLITLHNTKGLEFDRVVITGLEEGVFPLVRDGETDVEEERRLFYVGITRARTRLYVLSCRRRRLYGRWQDLEPSRFLAEMPPELVRRAGERGDAAPGGAQERPDIGEGTAVYHGEYGAGVVQRRWHSEGGDSGGHTMVLVRFRTGKSIRFVLRFSGLEKIAPEDP